VSAIRLAAPVDEERRIDPYLVTRAHGAEELLDGRDRDVGDLPELDRRDGRL
jgi:hypothetical protein